MHKEDEVATDPTGRTLGLSAWLEIRPISKSTARGTIKALQCPAPDHQVRQS